MSGDEAALWRPPTSLVEQAHLTDFIAWLRAERGLAFADYDELWHWSTSDLDAFWRAIWDYFEVAADGDPATVLGAPEMPGARWFPDVRLNYAEHALRGGDDDAVAAVYASEVGPLAELRRGELRAQVAAVAGWLRRQGVGPGDRIVAYLPNVPEALVAFLACASIGAVWSCCSPDFGAGSVVDRFSQVEPKVLFAVDGYRYGGRDFDRAETLAAIRAALPSLEQTAFLPYLDRAAPTPAGATAWGDVLAAGAGAELRFERLPFDHPLWILNSSGTTGLPKAIVQGHGGILLEHLKVLALHVDLHPGDRFFWFTTTGWMMWNFLVSGLLVEAPVVLFDGNPGYPDMSTLWQLAADARVAVFGTSASYIAACMKAGVEPAAGRDLGALRGLGSTGSPLVPEGFDWVYEALGEDTWLFSTSGGTDVCTAFVGGVPLLPVYRGELQAPALGVALAAWDESGEPVVGEMGELVITAPMPSMPTRFWADPDGARYRESYFEMFPGVWRHGDWVEITPRGTAVLYGRSDATINRGGIRMGTSEIYRAVLGVEAVVDALAVDVPRSGAESELLLFVVLREGAELTPELVAAIGRSVRERCSPRHVPDRIEAIAEVPRTLTGKVVEVPVKRILMGVDPSRAASREALANPAALDHFIALAAARGDLTEIRQTGGGT
ncbi:MAG: acetoacetate--CoA ligase [Actinobacteria bacterium]|nr:acetoacetate--CoA ligase [Actinomycetota bacterium]